MSKLSYIEKGNTFTVELLLPVSYSKSTMKNGQIIAQDLKVESNNIKQRAIFSVELQVTTKAMVTADTKESASKLMKKVGEINFSEVCLLKSPTFSGLKGSSTTTDGHKFHSDFIAEATKLAIAHITSLNNDELNDLLSSAKETALPTKFLSVKPSFAKKFKESSVHIQETTINNHSHLSELHLEYDGGKQQSDGKIKLYGLRKPDDKAGRKLSVLFDNNALTSLRSIDGQESIEISKEEKSTCLEVKSSKGTFPLSLLCQESIDTIMDLDKIVPKVHLSNIIDDTDTITYALPNNENIFSKEQSNTHENINKLDRDAEHVSTERNVKSITSDVRRQTTTDNYSSLGM